MNKDFFRNIKNWFLSLKLEEKFSFLFSFSVLTISLFTTVVTSIFDLDDQWVIRAICLILSGLSFNSLWEQYVLIKGIEKKVNSLIDDKKIISSRYELESSYPLSEMWKDCDSVHIASMGSTQLFTTKRDILEKSISEGTDFEFILVEPTSMAMQEHLDNKCEDNFGVTKSAVEKFHDTIINLTKSQFFADSLDFYYTEINLPYALMIVNKRDVNLSFVKVDLYSIGVKDSERPSFIIYADDELFPFFIHQYNNIRKKSHPII